MHKNSNFRTATTEIFHLLETKYSQSHGSHSSGINMVLVATTWLLGLKNLHEFFWKELLLHESLPFKLFSPEYQQALLAP